MQITPHIRKGHYRRIGKRVIWIRATIVNKVAFFLHFNKLKKEQQDKYFEEFLQNIGMEQLGAKVANTQKYINTQKGLYHAR